MSALQIRMHRGILAVLAVLAFGAGLAMAQTGPQEDERRDPPNDQRRPRRDRGDRGDRGQRDWRERMRQYENATPEERRKLRIDGWVAGLTRMYELNDEQVTTVRAEVQKISDEYRASMGKDAEEMDRVGEEMRKYWQERWQRAQQEREARQGQPNQEGQNGEQGQDGQGGRGGRRGGRGGRGFGAGWEEARNDPKFQELQKRFEELQQKYPFDWQKNAERIEQLLPPEQVAKARERRDQWMQRGGQGGGPGGFGQGQGGRQAGRGRDRENDNGQGEGRGRFGRGRGRGPGQGPEGNDDGNRRRRGDGEQARDGGNPLAGPGGEKEQKPQVVKLPPHPWDTYAENYITQHRLTEVQAASARSIVKDLKARQTAILASQASDRTAAEKINNPQAKVKRMAELDAPVEALFKELQNRLESLLTTEQRADR